MDQPKKETVCVRIGSETKSDWESIAAQYCNGNMSQMIFEAVEQFDKNGGFTQRTVIKFFKSIKSDLQNLTETMIPAIADTNPSTMSQIVEEQVNDIDLMDEADISDFLDEDDTF